MSVSLLSIIVASCAVAPPNRFTEPQASDRFTPCSAAPHCVSSQAAENSAKHVAPLRFTGDADRARDVLLQVLHHHDKAKIVTSDATFVHATFRSKVGFVDDVTFIIHPQQDYIDVKSSSRIGYYDFGVNRRRVERLRKQFSARLNR